MRRRLDLLFVLWLLGKVYCVIMAFENGSGLVNATRFLRTREVFSILVPMKKYI